MKDKTYTREFFVKAGAIGGKRTAEKTKGTKYYSDNAKKALKKRWAKKK